jgi:hypothetical protein
VFSNEIQTLEHIAATTLRGGLASALVLAGRGAELDAWFGAEGPWWTPAYPQGAAGETTVPMPASLVHERRDPPFEGPTPIVNMLFGPGPDEYGMPARRLQWVGVRAKWLRLEAGKAAGLHPVSLDATMHVGLHYGRQGNREGALFSRREIGAGAIFQAWVRDRHSVLRNWPHELFLGKRRSAGNGSVQLACQSPAAFPWAGSPPTPGQTEVNVQLISDAIVRDRKSGSFWRGIPAELWSEWIGTPCRVAASSCSSRLAMGWSGAAGLGREQALAIAAGAAFRLECLGDLMAFHAGLGRLAKEGIGEGRHEGFGWVAVNPSWLEEHLVAPHPTPRLRTGGSAAEWPGLEGVPHADLEAIRALAQIRLEGENRTEFRKKVEQLSAYAARAQSPGAVANYAEALGNRTHDRGWKTVDKQLSKAIREQNSIQKVLFYLAAVATHLEREAEGA